MDDRDKELDKIIDPLRKEDINDFYIKRWQKNVADELEISRKFNLKNFFFVNMKLATATIAGFVLGALIFGNTEFFQENNQMVKNLDDSATVEYIFIKID